MMMSNLPSQPFDHLVGREKWVERILTLLRDPKGPPIISLTGIGGIGKTAIAFEVGKRALQGDHFRDTLWESAKQYELLGTSLVANADRAITRESLINNLAMQLGRYEMLQLHPDERRLRLQYIFQHDPYLIIVDNIETVEDSQALIEEIAHLLNPSRAIITSRVRLNDKKHVREFQINRLSKPESIRFIREEAQAKGLSISATAKGDILRRIATATGGMPLAIKFFLAQIDAGLSVDEELQRLENAENEELLYRYIYFDLWSTLDIPAQKIMVAIPAFASSVPRFLLQPVAHVLDEDFEPAAGDLVKKSLVDRADHEDLQKRRYSMHQLTRHFVNSDLRQIWEAQKSASPK
jgi:hypothetical protein